MNLLFSKHMLRQRIGKLLRCWVLVCMGMALWSHASARGLKTEDFPFSAPLEGRSSSGLVKVAVPSEVLSRSDPGLTNCRIFDDLGEEVPFFIDTVHELERQALRWEIVQSRETREGAFFLISNPNGADFVNNLEIIAGRKSGCSDIEVFFSPEGTAWQLIAKGRLTDLRPSYNAYRMSIALPETFADKLKVLLKKPALVKGESGFKACRIFDDVLPGLNPLSGIRSFSSLPGKGPDKGSHMDEAVFQEPACRLDDQGNTVIELGRVDLPVDQVSIQAADGCFYREVELDTADRDEESSYRPKGAGALYRIPTLDLGRDTIAAAMEKARFFRIRILNKEESPLAVNRVSLRWARRYLLFMPRQGRSYEIRYGSGQVPGAQYDLERITPYGTYGSLAGLPAWKMGRSSPNADYEPDRLVKEQFRRFFIIGVIVLITYFIGFWFIRIRNLIPRR